MRGMGGQSGDGEITEVALVPYLCCRFMPESQLETLLLRLLLLL
jgi:hypothetical protein